jgi:hypothetical protein
VFARLKDFGSFFVILRFFLKKKEVDSISLEYISKSPNFDLSGLSSVKFKACHNFKGDCSSIYPGSDDLFSVYKNVSLPHVFLGVGNVSSLDVASNLSPEVLFFVDLNKQQLEYLDLIINLIINSKDRAEFLANLFSKKETDISLVLRKADRNKDDKISIENEFWRCADKEKIYVNNIHKEFLNYELIKEKGLYRGAMHKKIGTNVMGKLRAITTFVLRDKSQVNISGNYSLFAIYRENGFLSSEERYGNLKNVLLTKPYVLIDAPLSAELLSNVCIKFKHHRVVLWLSNILSPYFLSASTRKLINRIIFFLFFSSEYYEIDILEDQRRSFFGIAYHRKIIPHWDAFRKVFKYLNGDCLEVVNLKSWVDQGSSLPKTTRMFYSDFLASEEKYKTIFIHILVGNGMKADVYKTVVRAAFERADRVILLEHNRESKDFINKNKGLSLAELISMFGEPSVLDFSVGFKSKKRNIIMVYNNTIGNKNIKNEQKPLDQ